MEHIGKSFIMVMYPDDFNFYHQRVFYSDFGFVVVSELEFFRDSIYKLCQECYEVRRKRFGPKIITNIRKRMKEIARKSLKDERVVLELVALLFDITYYTAVSHDKNGHLRKITTIDERSIKYFCYFGSKDYNRMSLIEKIQEKLEVVKDKNKNGFYFEILQMGN